MAKATSSELEQRWNAHPVQATLIRAAAFLIPIAVSTVYAILVSSRLPPAGSLAGGLGSWLLVAVTSTGVLILVDRIARRLLPLAALLSLSIVFPDKAPSRFKVARRAAGVRNLEARLEEAKRKGLESEPVRAAETILELVTALQTHDSRTRGHSERVHLYTEMLARELKLPEEARDRLRWAALVHDIGKLTVPEEVLNKPSTPEPEEWDVLQRHPLEGARLCEPLRAWLGPWWLAIEQHHEHFNGSGYPRGLSGEQISLAARIVSVADAFEVITAARSYKRAQTAVAAREELARCAGTQFDPVIVRAFLSIALGRMRLAMGPLAWVTQVPLFSELPRLGNALRLVGSFFGAAGAAVMIGAPSLADEPRAEPATPAPLSQAAGSEAASEGSESPAGVAGDVAETADPLPNPTPLPSIPPLGEPTFEIPLATPTPQAPSQERTPTTPAPEPAPEPPPEPAEPAPSAPASPPASPPPASPSPSPSPSSSPSEPTEPVPAPSQPVSPPPSPPPPPPLVNAVPVATGDSASTHEDVPVLVNVLTNDTDADAGDTLTIQSFDATSITDGTLADNGGGQFLFTPAPDFSGTQTFTYGVTDGTDVVTATATIIVAAINDPPSFTRGADQTVAEDAGPQLVVNWATAIRAGPANEAAQTLAFAVVADDPALFTTQPSIDATTGDLTFTPAAGISGNTTVTVELTDDGGSANGGSDTATPAAFDLSITTQNDPPNAVDDTASTDEDAAVTIDVLTNDTDVDPGDALTVQSFNTAGITSGALTDAGGGQFTFIPEPDFHGPQTFSYVVADLSGATSSAMVTITVDPQPDAPVARDDTYVVEANTTLNVSPPGVLANDTDADDDPVTISANTQPTQGTLALQPDGQFSYGAGATAGTFSFSYTVTDDSGASDTATATFTVTTSVASTTTFYLGANGPSGPDGDTYDLQTSPAAGTGSVPDHDGDDKPGLSINNGNGNANETDPTKYQHWTWSFASPTTYVGQIRLGLWSTVEDFDGQDEGHYHVFLHDCAPNGSDCQQLLESEAHVNRWNNGVANWVFKDLPLGSINHTFAADRVLRVRLMFKHNPMWVAMTQDKPTWLILNDG